MHLQVLLDESSLIGTDTDVIVDFTSMMQDGNIFLIVNASIFFFPLIDLLQTVNIVA